MRLANVGWSMNDGGNQVSAGPSAMEFMADHWLLLSSLDSVSSSESLIIEPLILLVHRNP